MAVKKIFGFASASPYRSETFLEFNRRLFGRHGLMSDITLTHDVDRQTLTLSPIIFVQNGLVVQKTDTTVLDLSQLSSGLPVAGVLNKPTFLCAYTPNNIQADNVSFNLFVSPSDVGNEQVIIAVYDGNGWRQVNRIDIDGVLNLVNTSFVKHKLTGFHEGFFFTYAPNTNPDGTRGITLSKGYLTDKSGELTKVSYDTALVQPRDDVHFQRMDMIVFRRPLDDKRRAGTFEYVMGPTYVSSLADRVQVNLSTSTPASSQQKALVLSNNKTAVLSLHGYKAYGNIAARLISESRNEILTEATGIVGCTGEFSCALKPKPVGSSPSVVESIGIVYHNSTTTTTGNSFNGSSTTYYDRSLSFAIINANTLSIISNLANITNTGTQPTQGAITKPRVVWDGTTQHWHVFWIRQDKRLGYMRMSQSGSVSSYPSEFLLTGVVDTGILLENFDVKFSNRDALLHIVWTELSGKTSYASYDDVGGIYAAPQIIANSDVSHAAVILCENAEIYIAIRRPSTQTVYIWSKQTELLQREPNGLTDIKGFVVDVDGFNNANFAFLHEPAGAPTTQIYLSNIHLNLNEVRAEPVSGSFGFVSGATPNCQLRVDKTGSLMLAGQAERSTDVATGERLPVTRLGPIGGEIASYEASVDLTSATYLPTVGDRVDMTSSTNVVLASYTIRSVRTLTIQGATETIFGFESILGGAVSFPSGIVRMATYSRTGSSGFIQKCAPMTSYSTTELRTRELPSDIFYGIFQRPSGEHTLWSDNDVVKAHQFFRHDAIFLTSEGPITLSADSRVMTWAEDIVLKDPTRAGITLAAGSATFEDGDVMFTILPKPISIDGDGHVSSIRVQDATPFPVGTTVFVGDGDSSGVHAIVTSVSGRDLALARLDGAPANFSQFLEAHGAYVIRTTSNVYVSAPNEGLLRPDMYGNINRDIFPIAVRTGQIISFRDGALTLQQGETSHLGSGPTENLLQYIGAVSETDADPMYTSNYGGMQGQNLTARLNSVDKRTWEAAQDRNINDVWPSDLRFDWDPLSGRLAWNNGEWLLSIPDQGYATIGATLGREFTLSDRQVAYVKIPRGASRDGAGGVTGPRGYSVYHWIADGLHDLFVIGSPTGVGDANASWSSSNADRDMIVTVGGVKMVQDPSFDFHKVSSKAIQFTYVPPEGSIVRAIFPQSLLPQEEYIFVADGVSNKFDLRNALLSPTIPTAPFNLSEGVSDLIVWVDGFRLIGAFVSDSPYSKSGPTEITLAEVPTAGAIICVRVGQEAFDQADECIWIADGFRNEFTVGDDLSEGSRDLIWSKGLIAQDVEVSSSGVMQALGWDYAKPTQYSIRFTTPPAQGTVICARATNTASSVYNRDTSIGVDQGKISISSLKCGWVADGISKTFTVNTGSSYSGPVDANWTTMPLVFVEGLRMLPDLVDSLGAPSSQSLTFAKVPLQGDRIVVRRSQLAREELIAKEVSFFADGVSEIYDLAELGDFYFDADIGTSDLEVWVNGFKLHHSIPRNPMNDEDRWDYEKVSSHELKFIGPSGVLPNESLVIVRLTNNSGHSDEFAEAHFIGDGSMRWFSVNSPNNIGIRTLVWSPNASVSDLEVDIDGVTYEIGTDFRKVTTSGILFHVPPPMGSIITIRATNTASASYWYDPDVERPMKERTFTEGIWQVGTNFGDGTITREVLDGEVVYILTSTSDFEFDPSIMVYADGLRLTAPDAWDVATNNYVKNSPGGLLYEIVNSRNIVFRDPDSSSTVFNDSEMITIRKAGDLMPTSEYVFWGDGSSREFELPISFSESATVDDLMVWVDQTRIFQVLAYGDSNDGLDNVNLDSSGVANNVGAIQDYEKIGPRTIRLSFVPEVGQPIIVRATQQVVGSSTYPDQASMAHWMSDGRRTKYSLIAADTIGSRKLRWNPSEIIFDVEVVVDGITCTQNMDFFKDTTSSIVFFDAPPEGAKVSIRALNTASLAFRDNLSTIADVQVFTCDVGSLALDRNNRDNFVIAQRIGNTLYAGHGNRLALTGELRDYLEADKTLKLVGGGVWRWDLQHAVLSWSSPAYVQHIGLPLQRNTIAVPDSGGVSLPNIGDILYVDLHRTPGASSQLVVKRGSVADVERALNRYVFAHRVSQDEVVVGCSSRLNDGESVRLYSTVTDEMLKFVGQSRAGLTVHDYGENFYIHSQMNHEQALAELDTQMRMFYSMLGDYRKVKEFEWVADGITDTFVVDPTKGIGDADISWSTLGANRDICVFREGYAESQSADEVWPIPDGPSYPDDAGLLCGVYDYIKPTPTSIRFREPPLAGDRILVRTHGDILPQLEYAFVANGVDVLYDVRSRTPRGFVPGSLLQGSSIGRAGSEIVPDKSLVFHSAGFPFTITDSSQDDTTILGIKTQIAIDLGMQNPTAQDIIDAGIEFYWVELSGIVPTIAVYAQLSSTSGVIPLPSKHILAWIDSEKVVVKSFDAYSAGTDALTDPVLSAEFDAVLTPQSGCNDIDGPWVLRVREEAFLVDSQLFLLHTLQSDEPGYVPPGIEVRSCYWLTAPQSRRYSLYDSVTMFSSSSGNAGRRPSLQWIGSEVLVFCDDLLLQNGIDYIAGNNTIELLFDPDEGLALEVYAQVVDLGNAELPMQGIEPFDPKADVIDVMVFADRRVMHQGRDFAKVSETCIQFTEPPPAGCQVRLRTRISSSAPMGEVFWVADGSQTDFVLGQGSSGDERIRWSSSENFNDLFIDVNGIQMSRRQDFVKLGARSFRFHVPPAAGTVVTARAVVPLLVTNPLQIKHNGRVVAPDNVTCIDFKGNVNVVNKGGGRVEVTVLGTGGGGGAQPGIFGHIMTCKNNTGRTIPAYRAVMLIAGGEIDVCDNTIIGRQNPIGITLYDIDSGSEGDVQFGGRIPDALHGEFYWGDEIFLGREGQLVRLADIPETSSFMDKTVKIGDVFGSESYPTDVLWNKQDFAGG